MAMVKKHHAWKVTEPDTYLYGEDIFAVHSIVYGAVLESRTFYAFALRNASGAFAPFAETVEYAKRKDIPIVPVLFEGTFSTVTDVRAFLKQALAETSVLGGQREGVVIRLACGFSESEFHINVCKSVRASHVQSEDHWTRNWRPCMIASDST